MKSLARPSFFRMFDLLVTTRNPGLKLARWTHDGVDFERERHSFTGPQHGLTIDIFTLTRGGRRGWSLMVTKEYWWTGAEGKPFKNSRWARPLGGQRADLFAWLRKQEAALDASSSFTNVSARIEDGDSFDDEEDDSESVEPSGQRHFAVMK
jgi:hypothetical protein